MTEEKKDTLDTLEKVSKIVKKAVVKKPSLEELILEWRKCRSTKKRAELLRKIRQLRK